MRKSLLALVASCAFLLASSPQAQTQAPTADARVIVKYKADSPLLADQALPAAAQRVERAKALGTRVGLELRTGSGVSRRAHVVFAHGLTSAQLAERLSRESDVEYAVPDQRRRISTAPNDPLYLAGPPVSAGAGGPAVGQWYLRAPAGDVQSSINVEPAWDLAPANSDIVVGVIDTGVRFDHPDLQRAAAGGKLLPGYDMISDVRRRQRWRRSRCRRLRPRRLADAGGSDRTPIAFSTSATPRPRTARGTARRPARMIGALTNNGIGMASVARNVRILPVRALGKCGGFDSDIIAAMRWAAGLNVPGTPINPTPARVLNLSLGAEERLHGGLYRCGRRDQRRRRGRRRVGRQQHRARRGRACQLHRRHRRRRTAACRQQSRIFGPRSGDQHRRAGRQLRQHGAGNAVFVSDADRGEFRADDAGFRRSRRLDLHRQLQYIRRHQLFGADGDGHRRADALGRSDADAGRGALAAAVERAALSELGSHQHRWHAAGAMRRAATDRRPADRSARMLLHDHDLRRGHARRRRDADGRGQPAQLRRIVVERSRRLGSRLGHQFRAPGRHDLRVVVHL